MNFKRLPIDRDRPSSRFLGSVAATPASAANPNSSWGWAKPLNQKVGSLLYTSNKALKGQSTVKSRSSAQRWWRASPRRRWRTR